jgi:predicted acyltransferase
VESTRADAPRPIARVRSIDVLRGLAITAMVLVNDAEKTASAPAWLRHVEPGVQGMTLADVVFPAFLFVVGLSAPLALTRARQSGRSTAAILRDVLTRTFGLLAMGVFMTGRADHVGWRPNLWTGLMYLAFFATWCVVPDAPTWRRRAFQTARVLGVLGLGALAWSYRGPSGERLVLGPLLEPSSSEWLHHGWWEILGTIGWVYLATSLVFLLTGPSPRRLALGVPLALGLYVLEHAGYLGASAVRSDALAVLGLLGDAILAVDAHVSFAHVLGPKLALALVGASLGSTIVRGSDADVPRVAFIASVALALAGLALQPLFGLNKHASTPSWALYSGSLTALTWAVVHLALARGRAERLAAWIAPAGASPLTAYLLHPLVRGALALVPGLGLLQAYEAPSAPAWVAVLGALAMTAFVVWATGRLARVGIRVEV